MLTCCPLILATLVPLTRLLMYGALGFWKICWMGAENWLAGCVQLWFSMAITKTVLIERGSSPPPSAAAAGTTKAAVKQPKSIAYFIWYPRRLLEQRKRQGCQRGRGEHGRYNPSHGRVLPLWRKANLGSDCCGEMSGLLQTRDACRSHRARRRSPRLARGVAVMGQILSASLLRVPRRSGR